MFRFLPKFERLPAALPIFLAVLTASLVCSKAAVAQAPQGFPFRATYYEVEVLLHPEDQTISGQAKVEFIAQQPGRTVVVDTDGVIAPEAAPAPGGKAARTGVASQRRSG